MVAIGEPGFGYIFIKIPAYIYPKDGRIIYANLAACKAPGYSNRQLLGIGIQDFEHGITGTIRKDRILAIVQGALVDYETSHICGDGREYPAVVMMTVLQSNGQDYLCARVRDLTQERERTRQLG